MAFLSEVPWIRRQSEHEGVMRLYRALRGVEMEVFRLAELGWETAVSLFRPFIWRAVRPPDLARQRPNG